MPEMSEPADTNTWTQWSVHVLRELERLNVAQNSIAKDIHEINNRAAEVRVMQAKIEELIEWKAEMQDVASPTQTKELHQAVDDLQIFRAKAVMIWVVVSSVMGIAIGVLGVIHGRG